MGSWRRRLCLRRTAEVGVSQLAMAMAVVKPSWSNWGRTKVRIRLYTVVSPWVHSFRSVLDWEPASFRRVTRGNRLVVSKLIKWIYSRWDLTARRMWAEFDTVHKRTAPIEPVKWSAALHFNNFLILPRERWSIPLMKRSRVNYFLWRSLCENIPKKLAVLPQTRCFSLAVRLFDKWVRKNC